MREVSVEGRGLKHATRSRSYLADTSVKCTKDEMTTPIRPLPPWREKEKMAGNDWPHVRHNMWFGCV